MFLSISEVSSISESFLYHRLHSFSIGLVSWSVPLKIDFVISNIFHLEFLLIIEKFVDKIEGSRFLFVFLILKYWFSFWYFHFFLSCQPQYLLVEKRSVFIDKSEELIASFVFSLSLSDVDTGSIAEGKDGLALIVTRGVGDVFVEAEWFLSHLN